MQEPTIRDLQIALPWGQHSYSAAYLADPRPHRDFAHAALHIAKACGRLMALVDELDHGRIVDGAPLRRECARFVADVVICGVRAANVFPGGALDLWGEIVDRLRINIATHTEV